VLEQELDVLVRQRHQVRADESDHHEHPGRDLVMRVQLVDPPEQPHWDGGHDERVSVEERRRLGGDVAAEVLEQELLLPGQFGRHCATVTMNRKTLVII